MNLPFLKAKLEKAGVRFGPGLTPSELNRIEMRFSFRFPPDLSEFLGYALPHSKDWPDWRYPNRLQQRLLSPLNGILFDIEHNAFWMKDFGERPDDLQTALDIATTHIGKMPKLIPIYAHRFMPDDPHKAGNPVFSIHQTDIIYYGRDLEDYLENEFGNPKQPMEEAHGIAYPPPIRKIEFWSELADANGKGN